jgi:hypothetical protein
MSGMLTIIMVLCFIFYRFVVPDICQQWKSLPEHQAVDFVRIAFGRHLEAEKSVFMNS